MAHRRPAGPADTAQGGHEPVRRAQGRAAGAVAAALLMAAAACAQAQIVIGQTAGFSGVVAAGVKEATDGARLWLDAVNAKGGVNGRRIELVSLDDRFDPRLAADNARRLIVERKAVALFLTRGTPHTQAVMPLLTEHKVALVGPSTGAMALHRPVHPYVFNVRAPYQREGERLVQHLATIGLARIAVLVTDDSFGADLLAGVEKGFRDSGGKPLWVEKISRDQPELAAPAKKVAGSDAQAVIFIASGTTVAEGTKAIRAAGSRAQIVTMSNNAAAGFAKSMGEFGRGTIVSQVFPHERSLSTPIVKEAAALAQARGGNDGDRALTPAMMEGYAAAKVLVEALRRAGPNPTREGVVAALNGLQRLDLGGMELSYGPADHTGLDFVDLSIIGADGTFRR